MNYGILETQDVACVANLLLYNPNRNKRSPINKGKILGKSKKTNGAYLLRSDLRRLAISPLVAFSPPPEFSDSRFSNLKVETKTSYFSSSSIGSAAVCFSFSTSHRCREIFFICCVLLFSFRWKSSSHSSFSVLLHVGNLNSFFLHWNLIVSNQRDWKVHEI